MSDGDLAALGQGLKTERQRRETEDQAERAERQRREVEEVKAGTRQARYEHIIQLSPTETAALVETGALAHLGIGKSKRRGQR
jgi:hypothetical protein